MTTKSPASLCYAGSHCGQKAEIDVVTSEHYRERDWLNQLLLHLLVNVIKRN